MHKFGAPYCPEMSELKFWTECVANLRNYHEHRASHTNDAIQADLAKVADQAVRAMDELRQKFEDAYQMGE